MGKKRRRRRKKRNEKGTSMHLQPLASPAKVRLDAFNTIK